MLPFAYVTVCHFSCVVAVRSLRPIEPISALARSGKVHEHPPLEWDYDEERNAQLKINPRTRTVPSLAALSHCLLRNGAWAFGGECRYLKVIRIYTHSRNIDKRATNKQRERERDISLKAQLFCMVALSHSLVVSRRRRLECFPLIPKRLGRGLGHRAGVFRSYSSPQQREAACVWSDLAELMHSRAGLSRR